ncbi:uncharacterized protein [Typha angustifolia]|uniref:uncharacterized protein n=1 Tax=Typha angustifolia TaxID=59011 RepID=UPI003C2D3BC3
MKVEQLVGNLQIFESSLSKLRKSKWMALSTVEQNLEESDDESDLDVEMLTMFVKKFNKFFRKPNKLNAEKLEKSKAFVKRKNTVSSNTGGTNNNVKQKNKNFENKVQCFEYSSFGHIAQEYPNRLKRKGKAMKVTWDDSDESIDDSEKDEENFVAFTSSLLYTDSIVDTDSTDDQDMLPAEEAESEIQKAYNDLYLESFKLKKSNLRLLQRLKVYKRKNT